MSGNYTSGDTEIGCRPALQLAFANNDWRSVDARGVLLYRIYRFNHALSELFSSNYSHWMSKRHGSSNSKTVRISEYIYVQRDVLELLSPDSEISGERKMATANRMGSSYKCLAIPTT